MKTFVYILLICSVLTSCKTSNKLTPYELKGDVKVVIKSSNPAQDINHRETLEFDKKGNRIFPTEDLLSNEQDENNNTIVTYYTDDYDGDINEISYTLTPSGQIINYSDPYSGIDYYYDKNGHMKLSVWMSEGSFRITEYFYDDKGMLIKSVDYEADEAWGDTQSPFNCGFIPLESTARMLQYMNYLFDDKGNWTLRTVISDNGIRSYEKRTIEYWSDNEK